MDDWFTVEQIEDDTYAISEYRHWEETHCYLLCGTDRAALIDTGLGVSNIRLVVDRLTALPVTVLTTHAHWDHIGGHARFAHIGVHAAERAWISSQFPLPLQAVKRSLTCKPCAFPPAFDLDAYQLFRGTPEFVYRDGFTLDLGGRRLTAVHTPGHSPGHCCFYEAERRHLYSGDLVYRGCLDAFYPTTDPLKFRQSVRKLLSLQIDRVFPGHHQLLIPAAIIGRIDAAFDELARGERLKQGQGVFDFGDFQIHL